MKKIFLILLIGLTDLTLFAQYDAPQKTVEKVMRSEGKIYVVVAVCLTILIGLILYLVRLDRKISRLEDQKPGTL